VNKCDDEDEKLFVKEYIKEKNIYVKLGMHRVLYVNLNCIRSKR